MEKRLVAAFALSVVILVGWSFISKKFFPPPPQDTVAEAPAGAPAPAEAAPELAPPPPSPAPATAVAGAAEVPAVAAPAEQEVRLETKLAEIVLTNKGGRVLSYKLKNFESAGRAVDFVSSASRRDDLLPLALVFEDRAILPGINAALFAVSRSADASGNTQVDFRWSDGAGSDVQKSLVFHADTPLVDVEIKSVDRGRAVTPRLTWGPGFEVESPDHRSNTYYHGQALVYDGGVVTRFSKGKIDTTIAIPETARLQWAGLEDQYFTALFLPAASRGALTIAPYSLSALATSAKNVPEDLASAGVVAISLPEGKAQLFVGPKNFGELQSLGHGLEKAVWFSSYAPIYACAKPIFLSLRYVHDHWVSNWGVAIILLTIGLRIVLFVPNQYSMVKMRKVAGDMQRVQPKLKAIQAKYKKSKDPESRQKMNTETMDLYKREGVNPFGGVSGCLPLLIQMPILWAFFDVLTATVELRGAPFYLWIHDLTHPDPYWITPILMGATMFVQQKMTPTANVDPQQQRLMLFMPVIFTVMFGSLPSGLVLYYFVNNVLGIGQQWLVNRHIARLEAAPRKGVMDAKEFDGKDLDDALAAAVEALGRPASDLDYEILEGGRKGVFGLGARPVRIRVAVAASVAPLEPMPRLAAPPKATREPATRKPARREPATREPATREPANRDQAASAADSLPSAALGQIISKMGFDLRIEESRRDGTLELTLDGPDRKTLAAKDGELLSAIEFVLNRMGRRAWPDEPSVRLVCRGFRSERDDELILMVREAAAQVARSGVPRRLHAMNPYERRVVHMTVRELPGMTTVSEGDGFLKRVRVEKLAR